MGASVRMLYDIAYLQEAHGGRDVELHGGRVLTPIVAIFRRVRHMKPPVSTINKGTKHAKGRKGANDRHSPFQLLSASVEAYACSPGTKGMPSPKA